MLVGTFSLNQWVEFYLNNTINLRPLTLCHVIPTKWRSYRGHGYCEVISPYVYLGILWYALQAFQRSIFSNLFARRQQRCGLWLPVLKQFVYLFNWEATVCVRAAWSSVVVTVRCAGAPSEQYDVQADRSDLRRPSGSRRPGTDQRTTRSVPVLHLYTRCVVTRQQKS